MFATYAAAWLYPFCAAEDVKIAEMKHLGSNTTLCVLRVLGGESFCFARRRGLYNSLKGLEQIKDIPQLASIPVVIWIASVREEDMVRAYACGAAAMKQCAIAIQDSWDQVWLSRSNLQRGEALLGLSCAGGLCCGVLH